MRLFFTSKFILVLALLTIIDISVTAVDPVTPNASTEAKALLEYIYSIRGKYTLSGQHNFPASGEKNTLFAADYTGKTPAVWSQDFGFAADGDKDSYLARPAIIQEAVATHTLFFEPQAYLDGVSIDRVTMLLSEKSGLS